MCRSTAYPSIGSSPRGGERWLQVICRRGSHAPQSPAIYPLPVDYDGEWATAASARGVVGVSVATMTLRGVTLSVVDSVLAGLQRGDLYIGQAVVRA